MIPNDANINVTEKIKMSCIIKGYMPEKYKA